MKTWLKRIALGLFLLLLAVVVLLQLFAPPIVDRRLNPVKHVGPYAIPKPLQREYGSLPFIADLHADSLLWKRDLLKHHPKRGHVDIPRLIEANVALQVFCVVSRAILGQNADSTDENGFDQLKLLSFVQGWPRATWRGMFARGIYQAKKLHDFARRSEGKLQLIKSRKDLESYLALRKQKRAITAGLLALEGGHLLEGKLEHVDALFRAGYRMMAATHYFDNRLAGSAHGRTKGGLTDFGRKVLKKMEKLGMIVDLAHVSPAAIRDTLAMVKKPVVVSHTGVRGTCNNNRNLSDDVLKAIAKNGGVIGVGFWKKAVCKVDFKATAKAMRYIADKVGVKHVALGSDFDGTIKPPYDVTGLPFLMKAMKEQGFKAKEIEQIMGGNVLRVMRSALP